MDNDLRSTIQTQTETLDITYMDSDGGTYTFKINNPRSDITLTQVQGATNYIFGDGSSAVKFLRRYDGTRTTYFSSFVGAKVTTTVKTTRDLT